jgi:hypothetical protein
VTASKVKGPPLEYPVPVSMQSPIGAHVAIVSAGRQSAVEAHVVGAQRAPP